MAEKPRILFVCTGNSCRSQMAEGWARRLGGSRIEAASAGVRAEGQNPVALAVMDEAGVDISGQQSTQLDASMLEWATLVVTLCAHADASCPALPPGTGKIHWPLADPAAATGTEAQKLDIYRASRDDIERRVRGLIEEAPGGHQRRATAE